MSAVDRLLDRAREVARIPSDYALAKTIEVERATISGYRHGRSKPDTYAIYRLAELAKIDRDAAIAQIEAERARTEAQKTYWQSLVSQTKDLLL
ncbi:hypothetical protein [Azospira sp. I09]|uniref:hypothetical protein n=1 Tax=Azospira sp. I09 TaxID=1765049 RepID=UPI00126082AD|nr:hypothetical protein [Azospira sp. I09]BBN88561.1 hypothetical protein AZSP09_15840 [Azospira sp. I09]